MSAGEDRRRSPRIEALERVEGRLRPLDLPVRLLNLSRGGFQMQVSTDFPIGSTHEFRFAVLDGEPIAVRARIVHVLRASTGGTASYVMGMEFADRGIPQAEQAIEALFGLVQAMTTLVETRS